MIDKKALKKRAAAQVEAVRVILRDWDPMGLAPGELAPADEYDDYAPHIVSMVARGASPGEISDHLEGLHMYDTAMNTSASTVAARIISAVLSESG